MVSTSDLIAYLRHRVAPAKCGIILSGSIVKATKVAPGDVDVVVVINENWMQRSKELWNGAVLDLQIGSLEYYLGNLAREQKPGLVGLIALGEVIFDEETLAARVLALARTLRAKPPMTVPFDAYYERQRAAALIERAERYRLEYPLISQCLLAEAIGLVLLLKSRREEVWSESFPDEFLRRSNDTNLGLLLKSIRLDDVNKSLTLVRSLLETATGEPFSASYLGSTPKIRIH